MKYSDIKTDKSFPEKGYLLAYTREQVIFEKYTDAEQIENILGDMDILELHLFDREKEYRLLVSESKRYADKGFVDTLADFKEDEESVYLQKTIPDWRNKEQDDVAVKGRLYVLNHVAYDDAGMAVIDNYRMYVEEGENA